MRATPPLQVLLAACSTPSLRTGIQRISVIMSPLHLVVPPLPVGPSGLFGSDEGGRGDEDLGTETTSEQTGYVKKQVSLANLPSWIKPGVDCRWWSVRDESWLDVYIHGIDAVQSVIKLGYSGSDEAIQLPFVHFTRPGKKWFLLPTTNHFGQASVPDPGHQSAQVHRQNHAQRRLRR